MERAFLSDDFAGKKSQNSPNFRRRGHFFMINLGPLFISLVGRLKEAKIQQLLDTFFQAKSSLMLFFHQTLQL